MNIRFKFLNKNAKAPFRATEGGAGFDLTAVSRFYDPDSKCLIYGTGIAVELPWLAVGLLFPRSSIYKTPLTMAHSVGVIDWDYRGEIKAIFHIHGNISKAYVVGDRVAQLVVVTTLPVEWESVEALSETRRGFRGLGSTGR